MIFDGPGVYGTFRDLGFLTGGHHVARTCAEGCIGRCGLDLFCPIVYPLIMLGRQAPTLAMMLSLYVTLGIFLLLAARDPSANRSLIAFTAWSSFAHAALMAVQAYLNLNQHGELWGVAALIIIGISLIVLAPGKTPTKTPTPTSPS